jgi:hypothetical protein
MTSLAKSLIISLEDTAAN